MKYAALVGAMGKLAIRKVLPVKKNRILFTSFNGHYSDNPKYISKKIHELDPSYELVWLVNQQYMSDLPDYVTAVDINDERMVYHYRGTARAIVDNVYGGREDYLAQDSLLRKVLFRIWGFLKNKRKQTVFTTWHGTPLKCMGRDQIGSNLLDFSCPGTRMILGNRYTLDIMSHLTFGKIPMELLGTPRNDILFSAREDARRIKENLGLPLDKKIILYAPTFRSDGEVMNTNIRRSGLDQIGQMDPQRLFETLNERFGGEWTLVCRFHYHVEAQVDWDQLEKEYPGSFINGNKNDDMAQYLACADLLLTDASSSMYDFALTGRPCLLYFPDLENYANKERGFYTPIETLPFPVAVEFEQLLCKIRDFDEIRYHGDIHRMFHDYGFVDDRNSSERIAEYILATIK